MALLSILEYPDKQLRTVATPVITFDDELQTLIDDMLNTMYDAQGVGLAASQVNRHIRLFVMDASDECNAPEVIINPEITPLDDERELMQEGCLSIPDYYAEVERALRIHIKGQDRNGNPIDSDVDGFRAHIMQHEADHLDGRLFVDYLSPLKRERVKKKMQKRHKLMAQ